MENPEVAFEGLLIQRRKIEALPQFLEPNRVELLGPLHRHLVAVLPRVVLLALLQLHLVRGRRKSVVVVSSL